MKKSKQSGSRKRKGRSSSSEGSEYSSGSSYEKVKKGKKIIGKLKGDLQECDSLYQVKYKNVLRDRNELEQTTQEFTHIIKGLKQQIDKERKEKQALETEFKLFQSESKRNDIDAEKHIDIIKQYEMENMDLRDLLNNEKQLLLEKRNHWKGKKEAFRSEIDKLKETNNSFTNKISHYEQMISNLEAANSDERDKMNTVENNIDVIRRDLEDAKKEAKAAQEKSNADDSQIIQLSMKLEFESKTNDELRGTIEDLKRALTEQAETYEKKKKERKEKERRTCQEQEQLIAKLEEEKKGLRDEICGLMQQGADLEYHHGLLKQKYDDTFNDLRLAEVKLSDYVKTQESLMEQRLQLSERDKEIAGLRELVIVGRVNKEI